MRGPRSVLVVGGGPAGLYAAHLFKWADPGRSVSLFERNPPDSTSGWGVVFSVKALDRLREVDPETAAEVEREIIRLDGIEVSYRGRVVRAPNPICALGRRTLLKLLRTKCERDGVDLHFNRRWDDVTDLGDHELVVAADGVRSRVRDARRDAFKPVVTPGRNKFIWLGTPRLFDRFLFTFRDSPHGPFWAYAYRFDDGLSTFNIECSLDTWKRAGLDRASEADSLALCEQVFAEDLQGAPLLANRSAWMSFQTVRNRTWSNGNVVLVGDAAHTTHYTVGSGTRLAMEDAGALVIAASVSRDLASALAQYEADRRPATERRQAAAGESMRWFEGVDRRLTLPPEQFSAALMMRSKELTFTHLNEMDGAFARRAVDAFAGVGQSGQVDGPVPVACPFRLGSLVLAGRVIGSASAADLLSSRWSGADALGPMAMVFADGRLPTALADCERAWRDLVQVMQSRGVPLAVRLGAGMGHPVTTLVEAADAAGIDAIEWTGGPMTALAATRALWPASKPLLVRAPVGWYRDADVATLAGRLRSAGCDALVIAQRGPCIRSVRGEDLSEIVRNVWGLATLLTGVVTADEANTLLLSGRADLCMPPAEPTGRVAQRGLVECSTPMS